MFTLQSDADSVCLICHIDLNQGAGGKTELQCSHTFHKEVIQARILTSIFNSRMHSVLSGLSAGSSPSGHSNLLLSHTQNYRQFRASN